MSHGVDYGYLPSLTGPSHPSPWLHTSSLSPRPHYLSCTLHQVCTVSRPPVLNRYPTKYLVYCLPVIHIHLTPSCTHSLTLQTPHINWIDSLLATKTWYTRDITRRSQVISGDITHTTASKRSMYLVSLLTALH